MAEEPLEIFLFYEGTDRNQYTPLTGVNLNRAVKQLRDKINSGDLGSGGGGDVSYNMFVLTGVPSTSINVSGGIIKTASDSINIIGSSFILDAISTYFVGINTISNIITATKNKPLYDYAPLYVITTDASTVVNSTDLRTWATNSVANRLEPIFWHENNISQSRSMPENVNAASLGPSITLDEGVTVTVPDNSSWTIL